MFLSRLISCRLGGRMGIPQRERSWFGLVSVLLHVFYMCFTCVLLVFYLCFTCILCVLHVLLKSSLCVLLILLILLVFALCCGECFEVDFDHLDVFGVEDVSDVGGGETGPRCVECCRETRIDQINLTCPVCNSNQFEGDKGPAQILPRFLVGIKRHCLCLCYFGLGENRTVELLKLGDHCSTGGFGDFPRPLFAFFGFEDWTLMSGQPETVSF